MGGRAMSEWTYGARLLKEFAEQLLKEEEKTAIVKGGFVSRPRYLVADLHSGEQVIVEGTVLRNADYEQSIRHKRPPKLVEAILLDIIKDMNGGTLTDEFFMQVEEALQSVPSGEAYKEWIKGHEDIDRLTALMSAQRDMTITKCKGATNVEWEMERVVRVDVTKVMGMVDNTSETELEGSV
jgi:hypothetical protein